MIEARKSGATSIITIDPYRSPTADAIRLARLAPAGDRRRPRPRPDARDLVARASQDEDYLRDASRDRGR